MNNSRRRGLRTYQAIASHVIGSAKYGFSIERVPLGESHTVKDAAIADGFRLCGSDDFNVVVIERDRVIAVYWMDNLLNEPPDLLAEIGYQIGLFR
jgi:hypothetical protein